MKVFLSLRIASLIFLASNGLHAQSTLIRLQALSREQGRNSSEKALPLRNDTLPISNLPSSISYLGVTPKLMMDPAMAGETEKGIKKLIIGETGSEKPRIISPSEEKEEHCFSSHAYQEAERIDARMGFLLTERVEFELDDDDDFTSCQPASISSDVTPNAEQSQELGSFSVDSSSREEAEEDRFLSKLAYADEVQGVDGAGGSLWQELLDASSTGATQQFAAEVEFRKNSNVIIPPHELAAALQVVSAANESQISKEKIFNQATERLRATSIKMGELEALKAQLEEDLANDTRKKSAEGWTNFLNSEASKIRSKSILVDQEHKSQKIQEYMHQKSLEGASLRIANTKMDAAMMESQEAAIAEAFYEADCAHANLLYTWLHNRILGGTAMAYRNASNAEISAYKKYAKLVMNEALNDAKQGDNAYDEWKDRVATDTLVALETKTLESNAKINGNRTIQTKTRWNHCRAQAILEADQAALKTAWPVIDRERLTLSSCSNLSDAQLKGIGSFQLNFSSQEVPERNTASPNPDELRVAATQVALDTKTSRALKENIITGVVDQIKEIAIKKGEKKTVSLSNNARRQSTDALILASEAQQNAERDEAPARRASVDAILVNQGDDFQKIQECMIQKTVEATKLRMVNTKMDVAMIERQERAIIDAFYEANFILAKSKCDWDSNRMISGVMSRVNANLKEIEAQKYYAQLVLDEALSDAQQKIPGAYDAWQNRVLTDSLVVLEREALTTSCQGDSAAKVEVKWSCARAKAILEADKVALQKAWPLGEMSRESERNSTTDTTMPYAELTDEALSARTSRNDSTNYSSEFLTIKERSSLNRPFSMASSIDLDWTEEEWPEDRSTSAMISTRAMISSRGYLFDANQLKMIVGGSRNILAFPGQYERLVEELEQHDLIKLIEDNAHVNKNAIDKQKIIEQLKPLENLVEEYLKAEKISKNAVFFRRSIDRSGNRIEGCTCLKNGIALTKFCLEKGITLEDIGFLPEKISLCESTNMAGAMSSLDLLGLKHHRIRTFKAVNYEKPMGAINALKFGISGNSKFANLEGRSLATYRISQLLDYNEIVPKTELAIHYDKNSSSLLFGLSQLFIDHGKNLYKEEPRKLSENALEYEIKKYLSGKANIEEVYKIYNWWLQNAALGDPYDELPADWKLAFTKEIWPNLNQVDKKSSLCENGHPINRERVLELSQQGVLFFEKVKLTTVDQEINFEDPHLQQEMANAHIIDLLTGQVDRNPGNFIYKQDANGSWHVYLIDNDLSFPPLFNSLSDEMLGSLEGADPLKKLPRLIDATMAEKILNLKPEEIEEVLIGTGLTKEEIEATAKENIKDRTIYEKEMEGRLGELKQHIRNIQQGKVPGGCLVTEWNEKTFHLLMEKANNQYDNYIGRTIEDRSLQQKRLDGILSEQKQFSL